MEGIDERVLIDIAELAADEPGMILDLVDLYLAQLDDHEARMRSAHAASDARSLNFHAHSLKSASANLGAHALASLCRLIEADAVNGRLPDGATFVAFGEEVVRVRTWFRRWRREHAAA